VGAIFDLLLEGIQLGILRVRAVTEKPVLGEHQVKEERGKVKGQR